MHVPVSGAASRAAGLTSPAPGLRLAPVLVLFVALVGCSSTVPSPTDVGPRAPAGSAPLAQPGAPVETDHQDVWTLLGGSPSFSTMVRLVDAAGLAESLRTDGQWTVLAPTDTAFERMPQGTVDTLLAPENRAALVAVVRNHLVEGHISSGDLRKRAHLDTVHGDSLGLEVEGGQLRIEGALLTSIDLEAHNGVIHGVDSVLMPKTKPEP